MPFELTVQNGKDIYTIETLDYEDIFIELKRYLEFKKLRFPDNFSVRRI